ncbi:hypothetical protein HF888_00490 [Bermanella marisrubri]|uniref:Uncharacterized protein n=1 Tax=Bermanella marisrubri TaxID=207949 RepID=Q1N3Y6_9GAMM|nr:hypothetical protein [Bermanella marisrubri]EAT13079.1 hypothetical protein RED65_15322 [Oceanobacter sp. RED65] [Bermanella marisrubri]QIZ82805.1 hypothetical protein HF888_00490 [Bermanella marisrubri]
MQQPVRLGHILIKRRVISEQQLDAALTYQLRHGMALGEALVELGMASNYQVARALRKQSRLRFVAALTALFVGPFTMCQAQQKVEHLPEYELTKVADTFYPNPTDFDGYSNSGDSVDLLKVASATTSFLAQGGINQDFEIKEVPMSMNLSTDSNNSYKVNVSIKF